MNIKPLTDMPIRDESKHFRIMSNKRYVDFGILNGEMCAYHWSAEGEGRLFLKELERYAEHHNLKLTIPTVLNPRLQTILLQNGYAMKKVPYHNDMCELWGKEI